MVWVRQSVVGVSAHNNPALPSLISVPPVARIQTEPPDGTSGSYPDEAPVEDVEDDEACREQDATALVNPLSDLLRGHRGEAGVVLGHDQCGDRNHQVSVARVIFGLHIRITSHRLCGIHGERVAVALKQEATALVADHGTTLRLQKEMSRTPSHTSHQALYP